MAGFDMSMSPSMFQGGMGIFQSIMGAMNKPQRPVYQTPKSITQATNIADNLASGNMPGMGSVLGQIDTGSGQALNTVARGMGGSPNLGGAAADILGKTNDARIDLGVKNAEFKTNAAGNLQNALGQQGQYEAAGQADRLKNFEQVSSVNSALTGSGIGNMYDSLSNIAGKSSYDSLYNSLFGPKLERTNQTGTDTKMAPTEKKVPQDLGNLLKNIPLGGFL